MPRSTFRSKMPLIWLAVTGTIVVSCGLALDSEAKLERGQKAFDNGEFRAAIIDAKAVLQEEPDNRSARLLLGRASVTVGDGAAAEKELRRAIELGTDEADVIVDLGRSLLLQGKYDEILSQIVTEVARTEDQTSVMRIRADALLGLGQPAEARELYTRVLAIDAADLEAQVGIVRTYIAERNRIQARETLNHVLETDAEFVPALQLSGILSMQMRDFNRAIHDFRRAAELSQADDDTAGEIPALYGLADVLFLQQEVDDVREQFGRMQEIAPEDIRTLMTSARLAAADGKWTAAQETLQQILRRAPEFRAAQLLLGAVHKQSGNLGQAEMYLSAVVAASPDNARARRLLAETRLELDKAEAAREALEPIVTRNDADAVSLSMAAGASLNLGEVSEAVELLERGVASNPDNSDLKLQLALAYFRDGQHDKVKSTLNALPAIDDERSEFRRDALLVLTLLGEGNLDEALREARELRERWPGQATAHSLVGSIEMAVGDYEPARQSLNGGLAVAPDDVRLLRQLAQLDIREEDPAAANDRYLLILEIQPDDATTMISLAKLAARAEDHEAARNWLEQARAADHGSFGARALLAVQHLAFRRFDAAEEVAKEAVALNPASAKMYFYLGMAQFNQGNFRDAVYSLGKAVELAPDEPTYSYNLARAQIAQRNMSSARASLENSIDPNLGHLQSAVLLASIRADSGDFDGAFDIARRLRSAHPESAAPHALQAELLAKQGNYAAAVDAYASALDVDLVGRYAVRAYQIGDQGKLDNPLQPLLQYVEARPLDNFVRMYLAQAYEKAGSLRDSSQQYSQIFAQDPENFVAANNLAMNYLALGDDRAEDVARQAYAVRPDSAAVVDTLGWILVNKGNYDEGLPLLRSAVELSNEHPDIQYHLAAALARSGNRSEATAILEKLLDSERRFASRSEAEALLTELRS